MTKFGISSGPSDFLPFTFFVSEGACDKRRKFREIVGLVVGFVEEQAVNLYNEG